MYTMTIFSEQSIKTYTNWQGYRGKRKEYLKSDSCHPQLCSTVITCCHYHALNSRGWETTCQGWVDSIGRKMDYTDFSSPPHRLRTLQPEGKSEEIFSYAKIITFLYSSKHQHQKILLRWLGIGLECWELLLWQKWGDWAHWELFMRFPWVFCYPKFPKEWAQSHVLTLVVQRVELNS